jgi:Tfp pilus assembly protein PilO
MASLLSNEKYAMYFQRVGLLYKRPEIRASLEIVLSIFTVTILAFAAIRPTLVNVASLQKKIADQEIISKKADNKISQLINAQNQLNTFRSDLRLLDTAVPDTFSYIDSAKRVEYLARINNLSVETLGFSGFTLLSGGKLTAAWESKIAKPNTSNGLLDQVNFSVDGKPQEIITFLRQVENMDRLVGLSSVTLTKQVGQNKTEDTLKAAGQATFYFYSQ